ncbi:MAG TPA: TonB-dependent receptor [Phycisphaerales bacterium]|nr:TonB-dependent receptor [Phycisphaerales bacterium]
MTPDVKRRVRRCGASHRVGPALALGWFGAADALARQSDEPISTDQITSMSIEQLMTLPVTSVAGVEQSWFATPAALARITGEDIRRGGFRTIADSLHLAPGVFVGRTSSQNFSVGMRGFNGSLANKTLVLIDGRAVYDPLFGGVFWDVQDVLLEDLDRIEVIRGPGATLWGANAVNGVINVVTKSAKETQGAYIAGGGGTFERAFGEARYGFQIDKDSWLRVYGKWFSRDSLVDSTGATTHDDWSLGRGGFRYDHEGDDDLLLTVQADAYYTDQFGERFVNAPVPGQHVQFRTDIRDYRRAGANLLARVGQEHGDSGWSLQGYYDRTERATDVTFEVNRDTFDLDWRQHFKLGASHDLMMGLGARYSSDDTEDGSHFVLNPKSDSFSTFSGFLQDTITLVPDRLFGMIGSKLSYNTFTGLEIQPGARLWWTPDDRNTVWASVARAVRVPSRQEEQGTLIFAYYDPGLLVGGPPAGQILSVGIQPNGGLNSEDLLAYEAGYRVRPIESLTLDLSVYYNDYEDLIYISSAFQPWNNNGFGETYGGELSATWSPSERWRLRAAYSYTEVQIHGPVLPADERNTPRNQAQLESYLDLTKSLELNAAIYYVDEVPEQRIDSYVRLDVGLTWHVTPNFDLTIWGQNLLEPQHREFSTSEVERGVYVMGTIRF